MANKKRKLDFLFLYEHVVREYECLLLLKQELEKRGYTVEIMQLLDRKRLKYRTWKKPEVVVSSCMYDDEAINSHVYNNVGVCNKIVNLHWEQMLSDTQEDGAWFNMGGNAKKCIQTCWGEKTAQRLIKNGMSEQNCPVTGAIMMDFYTPQFNGYYKTKEELCKAHGLDSEKELMLYISSFGYASMTPDEVRELSEMAGEDFTGFAKTNRESMAKTLDWFDKYLTENKQTQLVYRRHPSEWQSEELAKLSKKHENFHVIFSDSVRQWVVAADKIFIWMSTAIAEVYFANKNCAILRPQPIEHEFDPVIYKGANYITNYESFVNAANMVHYENSVKKVAVEKNTDIVSSANAIIDETALDEKFGVTNDTQKKHMQNFPISSEMIEGYFDKSDVPAYKRLSNLLEEVYCQEPRDKPFSPPFKPRFNLVKYIALIGVHAMFKVKLHPNKFSKICPPFAKFAGRIYGYIEKAHISKQDVQKMNERIAKFIG